METGRLNSNGQVLIPAPIRKALGLQAGTPLLIRQEGNSIIIHPATRQYFDGLAGMLAGGPSLSHEIIQEHARQREEEDR